MALKDESNRMEHHYMMLLFASFGWSIEGICRFVLYGSINERLDNGASSLIVAPFLGGLFQITVATLAVFICFFALLTKWHSVWVVRILLVLQIFVFYSFIVWIIAVPAYYINHSDNLSNPMIAYYVFGILLNFCYSAALFSANTLFTLAIHDGYMKKEYNAKSYSLRVLIHSFLLFLSGIFMIVVGGIMHGVIGDSFCLFFDLYFLQVVVGTYAGLIITTGVFSLVIAVNGFWIPFLYPALLPFFAGACMFNYLWELIILVLYSFSRIAYSSGAVYVFVLMVAINGMPAYFALQQVKLLETPTNENDDTVKEFPL